MHAQDVKVGLICFNTPRLLIEANSTELHCSNAG